MLDFSLIASAGDDLWSDQESQVVSAQIAGFTAGEWHWLTTEIAKQEITVLVRIAQVLGDFNIESSADVLLPLAASDNREVALAARESLREMSFPVVAASAKRLASTGKLAEEGNNKLETVNAILDSIEYKASRSGAA